MMPNLTPNMINDITEIVFGKPGEVPEPCDIIFIFGGSHPGLWEKASEAYFAGLGKHVIVTGGYKPTAIRHYSWSDEKTPEAHVIRRELIKRLVPADVIFFEDRSTNTLENVLFAKEIYDFSSIHSILAVCKSYGVGRQCRTLKWNIGKTIKVVPYPFDTIPGGGSLPVTRHSWMNDQETRIFVLKQTAKIYTYGKLSHLEPIEGMTNDLEELLKEYSSE